MTSADSTTAPSRTQRVHGYCALCVSRCGCVAVVEDGRFVALEPDPAHPTGRALCAKGRAAPELVYHPDRLTHPLRRTRPKGDPDPGWERIGWDEALDLVAARMTAAAREHGPESVAFASASPSTSAMSDSIEFAERLMRAFGSPNLVSAMELCGWGRFMAPLFTWGAAVPGSYMPDLENAGCILFWGYNPHVARLCHAVSTTDALNRGARLIVVDPRRTGPARKADLWLRVRPGTDGALALGIAGVMIQRGTFDRDFIRAWTNGPLLVRADDGRLLRAGSDHGGAASGPRFVAWNEREARPAYFDPAAGAYDCDARDLALHGEYDIPTSHGTVRCRPAFDLVAGLCRSFPPARVEEICGIPAADVERAASLLWDARPVAYYAWSGVEMQSNATQIARAIGQLHALTGSLDVPGGNVLFAAPASASLAGQELLSDAQRARALGLAERPLGPPRFQHVTSAALYTAILERRPYPVRALIAFGTNLLMAHADGRRGQRALAALDFHVHLDLFMNPTAEMADIVLPVASAFEREALRIGFEVSADAQAFVQLRPAVVAPPGEARADTDIIFDLAVRLGLGHHFWNGDVDAAYRARLRPSGITLESLRANPAGLRAPVQTRYRKHAEVADGAPRGFVTPTRRVELYSETLLEHGYPPLPQYEAPRVGPAARPDLHARFPLILTCAKHALFCETQHRALPSLRRRAREPEVELHPHAAAVRGIAAGDRVRIETPNGSVHARARFNDTLAPDVVCGQHGWWQACPEVHAPGYDPLGPGGANYNLLIDCGAIDPVSGSVPHRAFLCDIHKAD